MVPRGSEDRHVSCAEASRALLHEVETKSRGAHETGLKARSARAGGGPIGETGLAFQVAPTETARLLFDDSAFFFFLSFLDYLSLLRCLFRCISIVAFFFYLIEASEDGALHVTYSRIRFVQQGLVSSIDLPNNIGAFDLDA